MRGFNGSNGAVAPFPTNRVADSTRKTLRAGVFPCGPSVFGSLAEHRIGHRGNMLRVRVQFQQPDSLVDRRMGRNGFRVNLYNGQPENIHRAELGLLRKVTVEDSICTMLVSQHGIRHPFYPCALGWLKGLKWCTSSTQSQAVRQNALQHIQNRPSVLQSFNRITHANMPRISFRDLRVPRAFFG